MQNVGIGDVLFIVLVLCLIHGILHWVSSARKRKASESKDLKEQ